MDLPKSKMGVDIEHGFEPEYVVIRGKGKIIAEIKKAAKAVDVVYLAPDPDREGEAIAWHLAEEIKGANRNIKRVLFNEITKNGITEALQHPREIDMNKFDSQQARRILDRLVGYEISPILWNKVQRGLSAGRVQSVAVRMIVEREREIGAFMPDEYWTVEADVEGHEPPPFACASSRSTARRRELGNGEDSKKVVAELKAGQVRRREGRAQGAAEEPAGAVHHVAPAAGSGAQAALHRQADDGAGAAPVRRCRARREGAVGLITYMRTDSTRLSDDAMTEARTYIGERYGKEYLPDEPVVYKTKKRRRTRTRRSAPRRRSTIRRRSSAS